MIRSCIRHYTFLLTILCSVFSNKGFALTERQAQDIRFNKAKTYLFQEKEKEAMTLFKKVLNGPFHYEAHLFLARYFFENKKYSKSFRLYQNIITQTYSKRLVRYSFTPENRDRFKKIISKKGNLPDLTLKTCFELGEKYFEAQTYKLLPNEFNDSIINLAEKYFQIANVNDFNSAVTKFYLSKIFLIRGNNELAVKTLRLTQQVYDQDPAKAEGLGLLREDIQVTLAEALAKEGYNDSSLLILLNLQRQKNLTNSTRHYINNFLQSMQKSFLRSTLSYQLKRKANINQLGSDDYQNFESLPQKDSLGAKDSFVHMARYHLYYYRRIDNERDLSFNGSILYENPIDSSVKTPKFTEYNAEFDYKFHSKKNRFWNLGYQFHFLDGRNLETLVNFQAKQKHLFRASHLWINQDSKWILTLPLELRTTQTERSATALSLQLQYQPRFKQSWLNPTLYGGIGQRSEGEAFDGTTLLELGLSNTYLIKEKVNWTTSLDYYLNSNSSPLLNYAEVSFTNLFTYPLEGFKSLSLDGDIQYRSRSNDLEGTINTFDLGLGVTYAF